MVSLDLLTDNQLILLKKELEQIDLGHEYGKLSLHLFTQYSQEYDKNVFINVLNDSFNSEIYVRFLGYAKNQLTQDIHQNSTLEIVSSISVADYYSYLKETFPNHKLVELLPNPTYILIPDFDVSGNQDNVNRIKAYKVPYVQLMLWFGKDHDMSEYESFVWTYELMMEALLEMPMSDTFVINFTENS